MARIAFRDVVKVYEGGVRAVDRFSLEIGNGEFLVLVGPSGCGKSTVLRLVAGLEKITSGEIEMDGRLIHDVAPKDRDLAMVFQNYALYPHMTVQENMAFGLRMRGVSRGIIIGHVRGTARLLGIEDLLDRKPRALSGGQRQRVALGRAIVRDPKCFLFDEPLSNLDARLRLEMRTEIKSLQLKLKTTSIYVTHDQEEAMTLGDRLVVMNGGVIQQVGTPLVIYHQPVNQFVAGFLGTPRMNFLTGIIRRAEAQLCFDQGAEPLNLPVTLLSRFAPHCERPVVLGIRPQALKLEDSRQGHIPIPVRVNLIEVLGDRMDVFAATRSGVPLVARVEAGGSLRPGDDATLYADAGQLHLFEANIPGVRLA